MLLITLGSGKYGAMLARTFDSLPTRWHHLEECQALSNTTKSPQLLAEEIARLITNESEPTAMVAFGRSSILNGIEAIASACESAQRLSIKFPIKYIGPSSKGASIFNNKALTYEVLKSEGFNIPKHSVIQSISDIELIDNFPIVLKATFLTGGCGQHLVRSKAELENKIQMMNKQGLWPLLAVEYLSGFEASYAVIRLGQNIWPLPVCYRQKTNTKLVHPDAKVKVTGLFPGDPKIHQALGNLAIKYDVSGPIGIEGVIRNGPSGPEFVVLECCTRLSGSTPARIASLKQTSLFELIREHLLDRDPNFNSILRPAVQFPTTKNIERMELLTNLNCVDQLKIENLSELPFSETSGCRLRITYRAEDKNQLLATSATIGDILGDLNYKSTIDTFINEISDELDSYFESFSK